MQNSFKANNRATIRVVNLGSGQVGTFIITLNMRADFHASLLVTASFSLNLFQLLPKKYCLTIRDRGGGEEDILNINLKLKGNQDLGFQASILAHT